MTLLLVSFIFLLVASVLVLVSCAPQFGGKLSKRQKEIYSNSPNFKEGVFINKEELKVSPEITFSGFLDGVSMLFSPDSSMALATPQKNIEVELLEPIDITAVKDSTRLVWFGHSTFLLQLENKSILIDPMFGKVPSPVSFIGGKRFSAKLPIEIENLPKIDAVVLSHDHYDHLDYGSIQRIKHKVDTFYTPLGVGIHLEKWGVGKERIVELDWWESAESKSLTYRCTPAQHASGRKPNAMSHTLWSSWVIQSDSINIFFSGDGGYADHFKEIGKRYGPFDFAMLECGQYNEMWPKLHMFPEQTAQAGVDIKAKQIMPIHWGAFSLSNHPWQEPVERLKIAADQLNLPVIIPKIGEPIVIESTIKYSNEPWWKKY